MSDQPRREFWIDVGGTFTDCIARLPTGEFLTCKTLSSGATKGQVTQRLDQHSFHDPLRKGEPVGFWQNARLEMRPAETAANPSALYTTRIISSDAVAGNLTTADALPDWCVPGTRYELWTEFPAPVLAMRRLLELPANEPLPALTLKLGTTRGTNALLERKGARTLFVTTQGFADVLRIGNQNRPRLFDLDIQLPTPLFADVIEVSERLAADGTILTPLNTETLHEQFQQAHAAGYESVAICLLHAFTNPQHEQAVAELAQDIGFRDISVSHEVAPLIKIVSRGDTTVLDAYLNPVLRDYVRALQDNLQGHIENADTSTFQMMTSAGGLVQAAHFRGKDSLLSGPAGGVIGFARVAEELGIAQAIGFDMGGTSTDVARFAGTYEREFETEKAGVRVVTPMLNIETVAAGGGSLCGFDGVKLHVGPHSAGANPGPACYGRGGPLTVTDINLALGRLLPSKFPFPLDTAAVEHQLRQLCKEIADSPLGRDYTPTQLAEGFLEIANANMLRAIRRISTAKGYDPAEHTLITFGGAGAQHACDLARELKIRHVVVHPFASLLSAWGIGLANVHRFREASILAACVPATWISLAPQFQNLIELARNDVLAEGVANERIQTPECSLQIRYRGVESTISLAWTPDTDLAEFCERYHQQHEQQFGYSRRERALEVVTARVEVTGVMPAGELPRYEVQSYNPAADAHSEMVFNGETQSAAIYEAASLIPGAIIIGPALITDEHSTIVIPPNFTATMGSRREIELKTCEPQALASGLNVSTTPHDPDKNSGHAKAIVTDEHTIDPVRLEIFNHHFSAIAEQMGLVLRKTACSTNVKERLDYSCAVFSPDGRLVVNAPHIPVHLGAMSETVQCLLADCGSEIQAGDVYITNDPYRGGSHLPDVTVITPVHRQSTGDLIFLTASRAHHAEIGGILPGSMPPFSRSLAEEGVRIQNFCAVRKGQFLETELRDLLTSGDYPSRAVDDNIADIAAQIAANQQGVQQLLQLVDQHSLTVVHRYMHGIQQAAAEKMRLALRQRENGVYHASDFLDDGHKIEVTITIQDDSAIVDFTGTDGVLKSNLNANSAIVTAAVLYVFRTLIEDDIPLNSGVLEPVEICLPTCFLNPPAHDDPADCAAIVGGNVETSQRVVDVLLAALTLAAGSQGTMNNLTFGDDTFGYYETICGGAGATPNADGAGGVHTHMTNTRLTDAEILERRYPVRIKSFQLRKHSGGAGQHTGGDGIIREIEFLKPLKVSMLSERRGRYQPAGLNGGQPGAIGRNSLRKAGTQEWIDLGGKFSLEVATGDVLRIETPGGGGFGTPTL